MTAYSFTLKLTGVPFDHDGCVDFSNAIYSSDFDLSPAIINGVPQGGFDLEAADLRAAASLAIAHLHRTAPSVTVTGFETDDDAPIDKAFVHAPPDPIHASA